MPSKSKGKGRKLYEELKEESLEVLTTFKQNHEEKQ